MSRAISEGSSLQGSGNTVPSSSFRNPNLATSQRWSILWSMENEYRQSMGQNSSSSASLPRTHANVTATFPLANHPSTMQPNGSWNRAVMDLLSHRQGAAQNSARSLYNSQGNMDRDRTTQTTPAKADVVEVRYMKPITVTVSSLIQMARNCPNLESLCLGSTLTPDTLYLETGDYQSTLQPGPRAGLTYVPVTAADGAKALGEFCPKLQRLWLAGCEWVTADEVRVFLTHCRQLQTLDIRHCSKLDGRLGQLFVVQEEEEARESPRSSESELSERDDDDDQPSESSFLQTGERGRKRRNRGHFAGGEAAMAGFMAAVLNATALTRPSTEVAPLPLTSTSTASSGSKSMSIYTRPGPKKRVRDGAMFDLVNTASSGRLAAMATASQQMQQQTQQQQPAQHQQQDQQNQIRGQTQEYEQQHSQPLCSSLVGYYTPIQSGNGDTLQTHASAEQSPSGFISRVNNEYQANNSVRVNEETNNNEYDKDENQTELSDAEKDEVDVVYAHYGV
ncbi:hypothetical protein BGZ54_003215 [Gamsiella multidivaricata]|nr:hypothetical protein BGZ54_003215 [Gamsiella multidivaricata]